MCPSPSSSNLDTPSGGHVSLILPKLRLRNQELVLTPLFSSHPTSGPWTKCTVSTFQLYTESMQSPLTTPLLPSWSQSPLFLTRIASVTSAVDSNQTVFLNPLHCSPHSWRGWKVKSHISQSPLQFAIALLLSCIQLFLDPKDYSPPGPSVHEISQARILEWVAISFYLPDPVINPYISLSLSCISCIGRWVLYCWATREAPFGLI